MSDGCAPLLIQVLGALNAKRTVLTSLLWIVRAKDLDKFPVAWAAAVGDYDSVVRPVFAPSLRNLIETAMVN